MSDSTPRISVIVPCFNAGATLAQSMESILGQTWDDFEVVWFDDGSTDDSAAIAAGYAQSDPRVRLIRSEHVGIVEALGRACSEARGRFLARMDADDVAHPERLARQMALFEDDPRIGLCGTQVRGIGEEIGSGRKRYEDWVNSLVTHEAMSREIFVECPIPHPTLMIRREVYDAVGGYGVADWAEDYDLVLRCYRAGYRMGKIAEPLLDWRNGPDRLSMHDARYSPAAFRRCKRHYLLQTFLKDRPRFYQWGAGEVGKNWLPEWDGVRPEAVVDVNPRKFGKVIHGVRVIPPEELPGPNEAFTVVAVGAPGARGDIRAWFSERGYVETTDFLFLA